MPLAPALTQPRALASARCICSSLRHAKGKKTHDADAEAAYPDNMAGKATIKLKSGEVLERFVEIPKGEPDNFMNPTEFRAKFDGLCAPYMNADQVEKFAGALLSLEEANSMRSVLALSHGEA